MKMLLFDFRKSEREFFEKTELSDFEIEFIKEPLNEISNLTEEQIEDTDIISVFITSSVTQNVIKKFKNLRMIVTRSTGYNHIDIEYCLKNNIAVFNAGSYGEISVAQYTFMLILALVRKFIPAYVDTQRNIINYEKYEGNNLENLSLGILGGGAIGSAVAKIANFFNMKVYVCSLEKNPEVSSFAEYVNIEELLKKSDILTLHIPYTTENYHLINEESFKKMKDGSFIVNTSRGELLDVVALYNNMLSGKIAGAALDVLECEHLTAHDIPIKDDDEQCLSIAYVTQKLLGMNNLIITPHIAYNTTESVNRILSSGFNSVRDYLKGLHTNQIR